MLIEDTGFNALYQFTYTTEIAKMSEHYDYVRDLESVR